MATYEEYLRENLSALERIGDGLSGSDERLDYAVKQIQAILAALEVKPEAVAVMQQLSGLLQKLKEAGFQMPTQTQQIVFQQALAINQGVRLEEQVPLDGAITSVTMHFPQNCNGLVDIAFGHGYKQICPISGFIALNDALPMFPTSEMCKRNETIWCIMDNHDGGAAHTVSCIVTMEGN